MDADKLREPNFMWGDIFPPKGQRDFTERDMVKVAAMHAESQAEIVALRARVAELAREEYVLLCANSELRARLAELDAKEAAREIAADADARAAIAEKEGDETKGERTKRADGSCGAAGYD